MHPNSRKQVLLDIEERIAVCFPSVDSSTICTITSHASIFSDLEAFVRSRYSMTSAIERHKKLLFEALPTNGRFQVTFDLTVPATEDLVVGKLAVDALSLAAGFTLDGRSRSHLQEIRDSLDSDVHYALIEFELRSPDFRQLDDGQRGELLGHPRRFPYPISVATSRMLISNSPSLWFGPTSIARRDATD